ncbi:MAG: SAM-dependent methyltransferase, partial [Rhodospirillaceae bacterium]|nr:SAM-dependent methyltransferase [Rhodospirillaceae bacterium]
MLLELFLRRLIYLGDLTVILPNGRTFYIQGEPFDALPPEARPKPVRLHFTNPKVIRRLPWHPALAFGEGYMDGNIQIEEGTLSDIIALFMINANR